MRVVSFPWKDLPFILLWVMTPKVPAEPVSWRLLTEEDSFQLSTTRIPEASGTPLLLEAIPLELRAPAGEVLVDAWGNVYVGKREEITDRSLRFTSSVIGEIEIPIDQLRSWEQKHGTLPFDLELGSVTLVAQNGDTTQSESAKVTPAGIEIESRFGSHTIPWDQIAGAAFPVKPVETEETALVRLRDGHSFRLRMAAFDAEQLTLSHVLLGTLRIPSDEIAQILFPGASAVPLRDPSEVRGEVQIDRSADGGPLRMGWRWFRTGYGTRGESSLEFKLDPGARWLCVWAGIDEEVGNAGSSTFEVAADGKDIWHSGMMAGSDPPVRALVRLGGARTLAFGVTPGAEGAAGNHADWGEPFVIY